VQARGKFAGEGEEPKRTMGWMVRTGLGTDAPLVAVTVQGNGRASLQYRKSKGGEVAQIKSAAKAPDVMQLERKGDRYILSVARFGEPFQTQEISGIALGDTVYMGLFVSGTNNKEAVAKAVFDNVRITIPASEDLEPYREYIGSNIEILDVTTGDRKIVYAEPRSLQAPNWTPDNKALLYNASDGLIYRFDLEKKTISQLNTGNVTANNNDHVISFDGKTLGLSSSSGDQKYGSLVYTVPIQGGQPKQITPIGPSYLHGWSPDGKYLVYTGERNREYDIYRIPATGGEEVRLTTAPGLDDGSEYSPDGRYIYFNSVRSGTMQLWRMKPDGSGQEQLTFDAYNNWFPHISPDGKWILFLSYMPDVKPSDHPFYKQVYLRLMPVEGDRTPRVVAYLYGGQGTINTPSWSPDSKKVAFVSNSDMGSKK
ncbi:biopolymer transporter TolR, partial [Pontibacter sp. HJ8]